MISRPEISHVFLSMAESILVPLVPGFLNSCSRDEQL
jgi:hypothetical protein